MNVGDVAKITATFTVAGVATDPDTVSLTVVPPTETKYTWTYAASQLTRVSAGVYQGFVPCTEIGRWGYRWASTGAATGAEVGYFRVLNPSL